MRKLTWKKYSWTYPPWTSMTTYLLSCREPSGRETGVHFYPPPAGRKSWVDRYTSSGVNPGMPGPCEDYRESGLFKAPGRILADTNPRRTSSSLSSLTLTLTRTRTRVIARVFVREPVSFLVKVLKRSPLVDRPTKAKFANDTRQMESRIT